MPISAPDKIITPWATSGLKATIPETADPVLGRAGFDQGFPAINMTPKTAGGIAPFGQDFNGILFDVTQALQFMQAGGTFPYDSTWATAVGGYPVGALVSRTDNQGLWRNTVANNLTDPESGGAGWQPEGSGSTAVTMTSSNVTLTPLQAAREILVITGALTANLQLIVPAYVKQWLVINATSGAFTITCKTASGSGVFANQGGSTQIYGDGTNIGFSSAQSESGIVGEVKPIAALTAPSKYLKCNGAAYSRALYPELFQVLVTDAGFTSQTFTVNIASPAVFTKSAHGFTGGERLRLSTTGALPTGLNTTTDYFVDPLDANTFRLMTAVVGGIRITTTGGQSGTHSYLQSWFGLGNGSTTFNVPDERANVLRGLDEGRGQDTGRSMGTQQRGTIAAADLPAGNSGITSNSPIAHSQIIANQYGQDLGTDADWSAFGNQVVLSSGLTPMVPASSDYLLGRNRMQNGAYPFYIRYEA